MKRHSKQMGLTPCADLSTAAAVITQILPKKPSVSLVCFPLCVRLAGCAPARRLTDHSRPERFDSMQCRKLTQNKFVLRVIFKKFKCLQDFHFDPSGRGGTAGRDSIPLSSPARLLKRAHRLLQKPCHLQRHRVRDKVVPPTNANPIPAHTRADTRYCVLHRNQHRKIRNE